MIEKSSKSYKSSYHSDFSIELMCQDILKQQVSFKYSQNFNLIQDIITTSREDNSIKAQFQTFCKRILKCINESAMKLKLFLSFFELNNNAVIKNDHTNTINQLWIKFKSVKESSILCFKSDHTENLNITKIFSWICDLLDDFIILTTELVFLNFTVKLKHDKSMRQDKHQNRYNRVTCTQTYHKYYKEIVKDSDQSWNITRVDFTQFNERQVKFNLHWIIKSINSKSQYQMTSIFAHWMSRLLKLEDFKEACKQAWNFWEYFQEIQEKYLHEL